MNTVKPENLLLSPEINKFTLIYVDGSYHLWFNEDIVKKVENVKKPTGKLADSLLVSFAEYTNNKEKYPKEINEIYEAITSNMTSGDGFKILKDLFQNISSKKNHARNLKNISDKIKLHYIDPNIKDKYSDSISEAITELLHDNYENTIKNINDGKTKTLYINCDILDKYNVNFTYVNKNLSTLLIENPKQTLELFNMTLDSLLDNTIKEYYIKFDYDCEETKIKDLLSDKLGTFVKTTGVIKGIYDIKPILKTAVYECNGCTKIHEIEVSGKRIIPSPALCHECGGRSFELLEDESSYYNSRKLVIEEPIEDLGNKTNPRNILGVTVGDNDFINKMNIGDRVSITGILTNYKDSKTNDYNFYIDCNNITVIGDIPIEITEEEEKQIKELSQEENIFERLIQSTAPHLFIDNEIRLGMLCSIVGGGFVENSRSEIHSLIISNPGTSKSDLFEWVDSISEKCIMTSGASSTGVGLTGAIDKDPITNQNVLRAGALVLASGGICICDELDKLNRTAFGNLNNMVEKGFENFNKGGINETLYCKSSFIGGANPKYGTFDKYKPLKEQINFPPSFLSRIDIVFICQDDPGDEIVDIILGRFTGEKKEAAESEIDEELLKKYLYYAKHNFNPKLTKEAKQMASSYARDVLKFNQKTELNDVIVFTFSRFVNSIGRLGGAIAKLHLRNEILSEDIEEVIKLKNYCFELMGYDIENSIVNEEVVKGQINSEKRGRYTLIYEIITEEKKKEESVYKSGLGVSKQYIKEKFVALTRLSERTCDNVLNELFKDNKLSKERKNKNTFYDVCNIEEWESNILK